MRGVFHSPSCWKQSTFIAHFISIPIRYSHHIRLPRRYRRDGREHRKNAIPLGRLANKANRCDGREAGTERIYGKKIAPPVLSMGGAICSYRLIVFFSYRRFRRLRCSRYRRLRSFSSRPPRRRPGRSRFCRSRRRPGRPSRTSPAPSTSSGRCMRAMC